MARASRSAGLKTYWRTVHAVASRLEKSIKDARAIVREGRARELTHTALRKVTPQRAGALLKSDRAKAPARFKLQREKDERRESATSFDFGANAMPAPAGRESAPVNEAPDLFETIDEWIDFYEDFEDYDDAEIYDANAEYEET